MNEGCHINNKMQISAEVGNRILHSKTEDHVVSTDCGVSLSDYVCIFWDNWVSVNGFVPFFYEFGLYEIAPMIEPH